MNSYTTPAQNQAHRTDPTWAKVAPGEYLRSDGAMIRKQTGRSFSWVVFQADGAPLLHASGYQAGGHSLTAAKMDAAALEATL